MALSRGGLSRVITIATIGVGSGTISPLREDGYSKAPMLRSSVV
jgi:hypothetical protein